MSVYLGLKSLVALSTEWFPNAGQRYRPKVWGVGYTAGAVLYIKQAQHWLYYKLSGLRNMSHGIVQDATEAVFSLVDMFAFI